jgi:hypothetical protein
MNTKAAEIRLNIETTECLAGSNLSQFPTAQERLALGRWMKSLMRTSKRPARISFLNRDFAELDDVVITMSQAQVRVTVNVALPDDALLGLTEVVLDLAANRGYAGAKLSIDRLLVRAPNAEGVRGLGRIKISCPMAA